MDILNDLNITEDNYFFQFQSPFTLLIAGPSKSGKTEFIKELIRQKDIKISEPVPSQIIWFYSLRQSWFNNFQNIKFVQGFDPEVLDSIPSNVSSMLVIDDLMEEFCKNKKGSSLFYEGSHHNKYSIILVVQNLFFKNIRTISLNSDYIILFKNPRDSTVARRLALQSSSQNASSIDDIYRDATKSPHSYLLFDYTPYAPNDKRFLTNVLEEKDKYLTYYIPK